MTKWIRDTLPDAAFRYGSIQVNYNYRARKHIDSNNLGPSYIVALGSFEGGQLWTGDRGILDCREKWCLFDGNTEHATEPYSGKDRFSFILFTPDRYNKLTKSICDEAKRLGVTACSTAGVDDRSHEYEFGLQVQCPSLSVSPADATADTAAASSICCQHVIDSLAFFLSLLNFMN